MRHCSLKLRTKHAYILIWKSRVSLTPMPFHSDFFLFLSKHNAICLAKNNSHIDSCRQSATEIAIATNKKNVTRGANSWTNNYCWIKSWSAQLVALIKLVQTYAGVCGGGGPTRRCGQREGPPFCPTVAKLGIVNVKETSWWRIRLKK